MIKSRLFPALALFLFPLSSFAEPADDAPPPITSERLVGTWDVSLYFSADAPPSSTVFVVTSTADGEVEGSFYGSDISESGVTVFQDEVLFTAVTSDGSGPYLHSGRLDAEAGMIEGQTLSTGRDFLMAWTAVRQGEVEE